MQVTANIIWCGMPVVCGVCGDNAECVGIMSRFAHERLAVLSLQGVHMNVGQGYTLGLSEFRITKCFIRPKVPLTNDISPCQGGGDWTVQ